MLPWGPYYSKSVAKPTCYLTQSTLSAQSSSKTKLRALRELGVRYIREFCNYLRSSDVPASLCARLRVSNPGMPPEASPTKSHRPTISSLLTQPQQFMEWDNCIKISVSFDYWRQMPVVNERRADRHVRSRLKTAHFCINLFNDVTSYLVFSLYFNYVGSSPRNPGTPVISIQQARASFLTSIRHSPGMGDSWMTGGLRPRAPAQSCRQSPWRYC